MITEYIYVNVAHIWVSVFSLIERSECGNNHTQLHMCRCQLPSFSHPSSSTSIFPNPDQREVINWHPGQCGLLLNEGPLILLRDRPTLRALLLPREASHHWLSNNNHLNRAEILLLWLLIVSKTKRDTLILFLISWLNSERCCVDPLLIAMQCIILPSHNS